MKHRQYRFFTLIELLVVIGIIMILAGILVPAVVGAQNQARVTQAKADMNTISTALHNLELTYGKMVSGTTSFGSTSYKFGGRTLKSVTNGKIYATSDNSYDGMIVELSDPASLSAANRAVNKRATVFLDPRSNYKPGDGVPSSSDPGDPSLWRDPWGNRYVVIFCVDGSNSISPHNANGSNTSHKISSELAIYSLGANGTDDHGCNQDDNCENIDNADDIGTWHN